MPGNESSKNKSANWPFITRLPNFFNRSCRQFQAAVVSQLSEKLFNARLFVLIKPLFQ
jgi:hypothetical protein